ncbi:MAG TPA: hypothetical protein VN736_01070 [Candidatus Limnocylindrales bacterium]|nr:hypothetical protein [Candidatus Limnocylindrales bacterium]
MVDFLMFSTDEHNVNTTVTPFSVRSKTEGKYYVDCGGTDQPVSPRVAALVLATERYGDNATWEYCGIPASGPSEGKHEFAVVALNPKAVEALSLVMRVERRFGFGWTEEQEAAIRSALEDQDTTEG